MTTPTDTVRPDTTSWVVPQRAAALTAAQDQLLRPHLVNLTMGEFSSDGLWRTTRADVDAIFGEHLLRALNSARSAGRPLRLMFQAHGGLNNEATGLAIAQKSVAWWLANGIYPIYFAWETGLFETIFQLMHAVPAGRSFADYTSDPVIQETVRALQAPRIWGGMKQSAENASSPADGGAYYVAQQLGAFIRQHARPTHENKQQDIELHAVGHSAGSIFHAWFLPCALALGAPQFRSLHLMAPAIRVDLFKRKLAPLLGAGRGIGELTMYTMTEDLETDDTCGGIYRKSLLYLIFHALEAQRKTPILGLEESVRADPELGRLFGLDGSTGSASVVWSQTQARKGRSASMATSHGGFDEDAATMGSIARRILGKADHDVITEYRPAPVREVEPGLAMNVAQTALHRAHGLAGEPRVAVADGAHAPQLPDLTQLITLLQSVEHLLKSQLQAAAPEVKRNTVGHQSDADDGIQQSAQREGMGQHRHRGQEYEQDFVPADDQERGSRNQGAANSEEPSP